MAIFRVHKGKDYTTINNYLIKDKKLTLKDKGMLLVLLSLPDNWDFSVKGLESICSEARNTINSILNHLEDLEYLERNKIYEKNRIKEWKYDIYELPKSLYRNFEDIKNEDINFEDIKNEAQYNTKQLNTKQLNTKQEEMYKEDFEEVWKAYPNKKGKANSYKSFIKAIKDGVSVDEIKVGLQNYIEYIKLERIEPRYIKHGSTWFNQKCWEDDYTVKRKLTTKDLADKIDLTDFLDKGR